MRTTAHRLARWLAAVAVTLAALTGHCAEYGSDTLSMPYRYEVTKRTAVHIKPQAGSATLYRLVPGDMFYVSDSTVLTDRHGGEWVRVSGSGYVPLHRYTVHKVDNPHFVDLTPPVNEAIDTSQAVARWALPVFWFLWFAYLVWYRFGTLSNWKDDPDPETHLRRTFVFTRRPYRNVLEIVLLLFLAGVFSLILVLALGVVLFVLLHVINIICIALGWAGAVMLVLGIVMVLFSGQKAVGLALAVFGGVLYAHDDDMAAFGLRCSASGIELFNTFNIWEYAFDLATSHWLTALVVCLAPIALFLLCALLWMLAAGVLRLIERAETWRYNMNTKCPHCQEKSEPATYLSEGEPLMTRLRPGVYGLLHITHPATGEEMPTMLLNHRDRYPRRCANCHRVINGKEGTDKHIAFVGAPGSGKTAIIYRTVAQLFKGNHDSDIRLLDTAENAPIVQAVDDVTLHGALTDFPAKTRAGRLSSIRLSVKQRLAPVPYVLYINDTAGESFTGADEHALRFARNVTSLFVLIDPETTDFRGLPLGDDFARWLKAHDLDPDSGGGKVDVVKVFDTVNTLITEHRGNVKDRINVNFVLVKKDLGYLSVDNDRSPDQLRRFITRDMGLAPLVNNAAGFSQVNFFSVSATDNSPRANIDILADVILAQTGIKY